MKQTQNQFFGLDSEKALKAPTGTTYVGSDTKIIYIYDEYNNPVESNTTSEGGSAKIVNYYADIEDGDEEGSIVFVLNKTGNKFLPGSYGGTYYPSGWYMLLDGVWVSDSKFIDNQLNTNEGLISANANSIADHIADLSNPHQVNKADIGLTDVDNTSDVNKPISNATQSALNGKANNNHNHIKADITDFSDSDYATSAQGVKANTALQEGDDISKLVNDEVYLQPSDNVSALTNDAEYTERGKYKLINSNYQALAEDEHISTSTAGNRITLATTSMKVPQKVYIYNYSTGGVDIIGDIDGVTLTNLIVDDVIGLMWNGTNYNQMFLKKGDEVVTSTGGRTASYSELMSSTSTITFKSLFESKNTKISDKFSQDIKFKNKGVFKSNVSSVIISSNYNENFNSSENKVKLSLSELRPSDDTMASQANDNSNYSTNDFATAQDADSLGNGESIVYLQWDLTSASNFDASSEASIKLWGRNNSITAKPVDCTISYQSNSFFDENTLTWNNQPSQGTFLKTIRLPFPSDTSYNEVVLQITNSEANLILGNYIMVVIKRVNELIDGPVQFYSSNSSETQYGPKLALNAEINY